MFDAANDVLANQLLANVFEVNVLVTYTFDARVAYTAVFWAYVDRITVLDAANALVANLLLASVLLAYVDSTSRPFSVKAAVVTALALSVLAESDTVFIRVTSSLVLFSHV